jgi:hypothetical protein
MSTRPELGTFIEPHDFLEICQIDARHLTWFEWELFVPTSVMITEPGAAVPRIARVLQTPFYVNPDDQSLMTYEEIRNYENGPQGTYRPVSDYKRVVTLEIWVNESEDSDFVYFAPQGYCFLTYDDMRDKIVNNRYPVDYAKKVYDSKYR